MTDTSLFSAEHVQLIGLILLPLGSGVSWLIWNASQQNLKTNLMWEWFTNHAHELTGYKPGDEKKKK